MGRKRTVNANHLPQFRVRRRGNKIYYYYDTGGKPRKEIPLGSDYLLAVQAWGKIHVAPPPAKITVGYAISQYQASTDFNALSHGSQTDYNFAFNTLLSKFADAPLDEVKPSHIQMFMDWRTKGDDDTRPSLHRAQREVQILGMIYRWAMARDWARFNPCQPVKKKRLPGRKNIYIEDDVVAAVYEHGGTVLREAMDIAYYTGQRPIDVLGLYDPKVENDVISLRQTKRQTALRIKRIGGLADVIKQIAERKRAFDVQNIYLLVDEKGRKMTKHKLRSRFEKARTACGDMAAHFQFRDLRAKAATDIRDAAGIDAAQALMGHSSIVMTEHYTRARKGKIADPAPRKKIA
jgi:integrase